VVLLCGAYLLAQGDRTSANGYPPREARFQITSGDVAFLTDVVSGNTWILSQMKDGFPGWLPLDRTQNKDRVTQVGLVPPSYRAANTRVARDLSLRGTLEGLGYTRVKLTRGHAGYLTVKGAINGKDVLFLVDTGAPTSHLDRKRVERLNLNWQSYADPTEKAEAEDPVAAIVNSIQVGAFQTGKLRVAAHSLSRHNSFVEEFADQQADGLLGGDILAPAWAVIDYKTEDLFLLDADKRE